MHTIWHLRLIKIIKIINQLKLITELFNYKPNTNEKSIVIEQLDKKNIDIESKYNGCNRK